MHYVLMIHAAELRFGKQSPEHLAMMQAYGAYTKELLATARAGDCAALEDVHTATTVQIRDGKRIVKDGPFAETREQLGGYYVLEARSEDEALDWAAKIPDAKGGSIEVRPVIDIPGAPNPNAGDTGAEGLKEYLLLLYINEEKFLAMSEAQASASMGRYIAFRKELVDTGRFVAGHRLDFSRKAKSVTVTDKRIVRDGPFAETREQLGGYFRLRARDLNEAIALAAQLPAAETGTIEIRPVMNTAAHA